MTAEERFEEVCLTYARQVNGQAHRLLEHHQDAEDVAQEVWLRLWQHFPRLDMRRVGGWLSTITHNLCIDHLRKRSSIYTGLDAAAEVAMPVDLEQQMEDRERLRRGLLALTSAQRSRLLYVTLWRTEETPPMGAFKTHLHRYRVLVARYLTQKEA